MVASGFEIVTGVDAGKGELGKPMGLTVARCSRAAPDGIHDDSRFENPPPRCKHKVPEQAAASVTFVGKLPR